MSWATIVALAAGAYAFKAAGVFLGARLPTTGRPAALDALVPAALFAGIIVQQSIGDGSAAIVATRVLGVAVGGVAVWRKAPLFVVIVDAARHTRKYHETDSADPTAPTKLPIAIRAP